MTPPQMDPVTRGGWSDERRDYVRRRWLEGASASEIAKELQAVSRNAVIGIVHRLGLFGEGHAKASSPAPRAARPAPLPRPPRAPRIAAAPVPPPATLAVLKPVAERRKPSLPCEAVDDVGAATVVSLSAHMCRWPIGDPASAGFSLCGARATQGPYCAAHASRAYVARTTSGDRSPEAELARSLRRYL